MFSLLNGSKSRRENEKNEMLGMRLDKQSRKTHKKMVDAPAPARKPQITK